ncbi:AlkA N-terminal domain-containing protein [Nocardioides daejeonensis]|uniref:AlkA N-terminal domain-containing protein n=1 Tax=Nocardioides daejeonensis TaxID=1046556 RepID=UPI000D74F63C|nr:AlkA N-terminal domain-containing protein [Nocardioides daejeonensis]
MHRDREACYRAVKSRDRRFDGRFVTAVHTTGIYCRPSCPARTPAFAHVSFYPTAAAAQSEGFRACKRCLPDATPGDPDWDLAADVAGRAMRLIADGIVDREGVPGLAARLGYTPRHLGRLLTAQLGAGPLALARARRAQTARVLVETTELPLADVAFAAGFSSVRQFNDTFAEVYASSPSRLRQRRSPQRSRTAADVPRPGAALVVHHRLPVRTPFAGSALLAFLAVRAVPGVEAAGPGWYARTLDLPHGPGSVRLELRDHLDVGGVAQVEATFRLGDLRDLAAATERVRRLIDADCDPVAVDDELGADPLLAALVRRHPGLRVPGHVSGPELAVRAVLGQQVSVAAARTLAARLAVDLGESLPEPTDEGLTHLFPGPGALAGHDPAALAMPRARAEALTGIARAIADGTLPLDHAMDREESRARLLGLRGIGPWTADYILMRALAHPDVLLGGDAGTRQALGRLAPGQEVGGLAGRWRPWRSYAQQHLWHSLSEERIHPCGQ